MRLYCGASHVVGGGGGGVSGGIQVKDPKKYLSENKNTKSLTTSTNLLTDLLPAVVAAVVKLY
jgi:hypothetical protein